MFRAVYHRCDPARPVAAGNGQRLHNRRVHSRAAGGRDRVVPRPADFRTERSALERLQALGLWVFALTALCEPQSLKPRA